MEASAGFRPNAERWQYAIYALALAVSLSTWFIVIRAPLWLDETVSMFLIKGGWAGIMSRQVWPDAPAYSCLLWLWTKVTGPANHAQDLVGTPHAGCGVSAVSRGSGIV